MGGWMCSCHDMPMEDCPDFDSGEESSWPKSPHIFIPIDFNDLSNPATQLSNCPNDIKINDRYLLYEPGEKMSIQGIVSIITNKLVYFDLIDDTFTQNDSRVPDD